MSKTRRALFAALVSGACTSALAEVSPGAPTDASDFALATGTQMQSIFQYWGTGLGPQTLGVAPQSSFVSLYGTVDEGLN
jgi:GBP family porin